MPWTVVAPDPAPSAAPPTPAPPTLPSGWHPVPAPAPQAGPAPTPPAPASENPFVHALLNTGSQAATNLGRALDAQRWAVARQLTGKDSTDEQMTAIRHAVPGMDAVYGAAGSAVAAPGMMSVPGHLLQGGIDTGIQTVMDPLTYETFGVAPLLRALKAGERLGPAAMRAINSTPLGRKLYDSLHWGGAISRTDGPRKVRGIQGQTNVAENTGAAVTDRMAERYRTIVQGLHPRTGAKIAGKGLTPDEQVRVGKAINGELDPSTLAWPKEQAAYRQLRVLTAMNYHLREQTMRAVVFRDVTQGMAPADKALIAQALRSGKEPVIPKPAKRVKQPYGEPQPRSREVPGQSPPDLTAIYEAQMEGLSTADQQALKKAFIVDGTGTRPPPADFSDDLKARLSRLQGGVRDKFTRANRDVVPLPAARKYTFKVPNQNEIDRMTRLQEAYRTIVDRVAEAMPRRTDYFPSAHKPGEGDEGFHASERSPREHIDPQNLTREPLVVKTPEQMDDGFLSMAKNTGGQVKYRLLTEGLGSLLDDKRVEDLLKQTFPATGNKRTDVERIKDAWRKIIGFPRSALVSVSPRHAMNVMDLAANTVPVHLYPQYVRDTMDLAAQIMAAKTTRDVYALTEPGRRLGALGGDFAEREPMLTKFPTWLPKVGGKSTGPLAAYTTFMNRLTWAVDTAAKQTYAELLERTGEARGVEAGGTAAHRLVDYQHLSPLQKALRYVAPFGTFRGAVPGAVLGGIARNPARAALYNRLSGNTMYGGTPPYGQGGVEQYNPTADIGRAFDNPFSYVRATLGAPFQALGTLGVEGIEGRPGASISDTGSEIAALPGQLAHADFNDVGKAPLPMTMRQLVEDRRMRYLTYGQPVDLQWLLYYAASGVVEAQEALDLMGQGEFGSQQTPLGDRVGEDALREFTGVSVR